MVEECSFEGVEVLGEDLVELGAGEDTGVELALTHDGEVLGSALVFRRCDLLEVTCAVVEHIAVEMVDLHAGFPFPDPGLVDERVAGTVTDMFHVRINVPPFAVMAVPARRTMAGTEIVLDLSDRPTCDGEETSVFGAIELRRAVIGFGVGASSYFDALENKRINHNTSLPLLHAATCGQLGKAMQK